MTCVCPPTSRHGAPREGFRVYERNRAIDGLWHRSDASDSAFAVSLAHAALRFSSGFEIVPLSSPTPRDAPSPGAAPLAPSRYDPVDWYLRSPKRQMRSDTSRNTTPTAGDAHRAASGSAGTVGRSSSAPAGM